MLNWLKKRKQKAIIFVDYEHWFYSYKNIWGFKPNVTMWRKALEQKYKAVKCSIEFHADFLFMKNPLSIGKRYVVGIALDGQCIGIRLIFLSVRMVSIHL